MIPRKKEEQHKEECKKEERALDIRVPLEQRPRCWYFQSHPKSCSRTADECLMVHDHMVKARPPICNFWELRQCTFGNMCVFLHDSGNGTDVRGDQVPDLKRKNVKTVVQPSRIRGQYQARSNKSTSWRSNKESSGKGSSRIPLGKRTGSLSETPETNRVYVKKVSD